MAVTGANGNYIEISIDEIGDRYGNLRLVNPMAYASMERSIAQYGQITPVAVGQPAGGKYEMVDGFKRYRAIKKLGHKSLLCRVLEGKGRALKSAMLFLNMQASSIGDLEQGMIIESLNKEDGLSQVEIATLFGRHKSWVCRRLSLVQQLSDEVIEQMRLGLVNASIGRELARLPRGNQKDALRTLQKYRFTSRETARLVSLLMNEPRWNQEVILAFPEPILSDRQPPRPKKPGVDTLTRDLLAIEKLCTGCLTCDLQSSLEYEKVFSSIDRITELLKEIRNRFSF